MELKHMSDQELARRMVNYIDRLIQLHNNINRYLNSHDTSVERRVIIQNEYSGLKRAIREDYEYISNSKNAGESSLYESFFIPSIEECMAKGLQAPTNSSVNASMSSSVYDARYYMTYYHSRDDWERIANS